LRGIDSICAQLDHSQANAQIAVVTIQTLDGEDASADYANQLEDQVEDGRKGLGPIRVLMLLASTTTSAGSKSATALRAFPDGKLGDIGREMVPDLRANDFDGAVTLAVGQIAQVIAADAKVTLKTSPCHDAQPMPHQHQGSRSES
jgi:uncharacterized protein